MPGGEAGLDAERQALVVEVARGGDHHVAGQVVLVEERPDRRNRYVADDLRVAEDLAPQRVVREHGVGEVLLDDVTGLVAVHENLFQDHLALSVHLVAPKRRAAEDVAEYVQTELDMLGQHPYVKGRVLLGRVGVHVAADRVDLLGDLARRAFGSPLEKKVLEEVRDPRLLRRLVTRAGPDPDADTERGDVRHRLAHEPDAVVERGDPDQSLEARLVKKPTRLSSAPAAPRATPGCARSAPGGAPWAAPGFR